MTSRIHRLTDFAGRYLHAAGLVAHAFTIGLASRKQRQMIARLAREVNYPARPVTTLPVVAIEAITSPATSVALPHPEAVDGNVTVLELLVLARLVRERAPGVVFEIGTFNGRTAVTLAANAPAETVVYTLDLPAGTPTRFNALQDERRYVDKPVIGELARSSPHAGKIRQLLGDSATFDFSAYEADLVFIDGSHAREYVANDSRIALTLLRHGRGIIVWHDYGEWDEVTLTLNELRDRERQFQGLRQVAGTSLAILEA